MTREMPANKDKQHRFNWQIAVLIGALALTAARDSEGNGSGWRDRVKDAAKAGAKHIPKEARREYELRAIEKKGQEFAQEEERLMFSLARYDENALFVLLATIEDHIADSFGPEFGEQIRDLLKEQREISKQVASAYANKYKTEYNVENGKASPNDLDKANQHIAKLELRLEQLSHTLDQIQPKLQQLESKALKKIRQIEEERLYELGQNIKKMPLQARKDMIQKINNRLREIRRELNSLERQSDRIAEIRRRERANAIERTIGVIVK